MTTLIFTPGLLLTPRLFDEQINALGGRWPVHFTPTTGLDSITAMAEAALDAIDGPVIAIGLSMGGYVSLEIARLAPQRLKALVIMDSNASADPQDKRTERQRLIDMSSLGQFRGVTRTLLPRLVAEANLDDETITRPIMAMAAEIGKENFALQQRAIMNRRDQFDTLKSLDCPGLFMVGEEDSLTPPAQVRAMADAMAGGQYVTIADSGHLPPLEAPEAVNAALLAFLDEVG